MSNDLISRSELTKAMFQYVKGEKTIGQIIDEQPTAYDVDKVVEELEDTKESLLSAINDYINGRIVLSDREIYTLAKNNFDEAIEIAKRGGIE
jgi:hypothetical protein